MSFWYYQIPQFGQAPEKLEEAPDPQLAT
ncbi:hypothetical protein MPLA_1610025 [Mesorhizobium sp. ORS 3359]|nr:hypothetical protein MPLA_1610025 [Mesorhizobium sp. ORS 3359]